MKLIKNKCYFCRSILNLKNECNSCPIRVLHYFDDELLYCVELFSENYIIDIFTTNSYFRRKKCYIINFETGCNLELLGNPGITPHNIKEKIQLLLTFQ